MIKYFSRLIQRKELAYGFLVTLSLLPLILNIKAILYNCYNAIDFSIYQQSIFDIINKTEWNPYNTIRNVHIFNDHFDPIIFVAVFFSFVFGQGFVQLLIFEWLVYATLLLSCFYVFKNDKGNHNLRSALPYLYSIILSKLLLSSFLYPIHPTTWSCLPLFWLTYFIFKENKKGVLSTVLLLCLFKESFSFALLPLSLLFLSQRKWSLGGGLLLICLPFCFFELYGRELLLGSKVSYGNRILTPLLESPLDFLTLVIKNLQIKPLLKAFYPYLFVFILLAYRLKKEASLTSFLPAHFTFKLLCLLSYFLPLLFLQIYANKIGFQYGSQFAGILLGLMVALRCFHFFRPKEVVISLVLFMASSMGTYTKIIRPLIKNRFSQNKCEINNQKIKNNHKIKKIIASASPEASILSTGGVIPFIMQGNKKIYHFQGFSKKRSQYDYLLLELNKSGDIFPAKEHQVQNVLKNCQSMADTVFIHDSQFYFAKGDFKNCAYEKY